MKPIKLANTFYKISQSLSYFSLLDHLISNNIIQRVAKEDYYEWGRVNESILNRLSSALSRSGFETNDSMKNAIFMYMTDYNDKSAENENVLVSAVPLKEENLKRLYTQSKREKDIDVSIIDRLFLKGVNSIPDLYVSIVTPNIEEKILEKEYMQYLYLLEPIAAFKKEKFEKFDADTLRNFIETNKSKLDRISNLFTTQIPKLLGHGSDGFAYDIGNGMVFKIFKNKYPYKAAIKAMDWLYEKPESGKTEAMIYDAGTLIFENEEYYYYIIQKMQTIDDIDSAYIINKLIYFVENYFDDNFENIQRVSKKSINKIKQHVKLIENLLEQEEEINPKNLNKILNKHNLNSNWLSNLVEEIMIKLLTERTDLKSNNAGITNNGNIRFFDPAYNKPIKVK